MTSPRIGRAVVPAVATVIMFLTLLAWFNFLIGSFAYRFFLLLIAGVPLILAIYLGLLGLLGQGPWRTRETDSAVGILRERYARGELTKEKFHEMMDDLSRSGR